MASLSAASGGAIAAVPAISDDGAADDGAVPLCTWRRGAADARLLGDVERLVAESCDPATAVVRRFGASAAGGSHRAWYLQRAAVRSGFADALWSATRGGDAWGVADPARRSAFRRLGRPALRCLECLEYDAGGGALGLHDDGETLLTASLMLSEAGAFAGGEIVVARYPERAFAARPARGDIVAWRGWEKHRVAPVTRGTRRVLVAEWWAGPDAPAADRRPQNGEPRLARALASDPAAASLLANLARLREAARDVPAALAYYDRSLAADPACAATLYSRGVLRLRRADFAAAEADFAAAAAAGGGADAHDQYGALLARRGDVDAAAAAFSRARALEGA